MNAQRLVTIVKIVGEELQSTNLAATLSQLAKQVKAAIDTPNESTQRDVENSYNSLQAALRGAKTNSLSPGLRADLHELKVNNIPVSDLVGLGLSSQLQHVFESGYTSVQTLDRLRDLAKRVAELTNAMETSKSGLDALNVPGEDLSPGESIVGMTIPRVEVDNGLHGLQKELAFFRHLLENVAECIVGHVEEPKVHSLRSSDFGIDVTADLNIAAAMASIIKGIKLALDKLAEFRDLRKRAEDLGVKKDALDALMAQSKESMDKAIDDIEIELFQSCKVNNEGRVNELKNAIKLRLNGVANRMDRGFSFEVRTLLPSGAPEEDANKAALVSSLSTLRFDLIRGPRLLELPEGDTESDSAGAEGETQKKKSAKKK